MKVAQAGEAVAADFVRELLGMESFAADEIGGGKSEHSP